MDLATLQAWEVESFLEEFFEHVENSWNDDAVQGPSSWYDIKWGDGTPCEIPGLGTLALVDEYGGEGKGEEYWVVFSITQDDVTRHFKKPGSYQSYAGAEWDGNLESVTPKEKVITVWV